MAFTVNRPARLSLDVYRRGRLRLRYGPLSCSPQRGFRRWASTRTVSGPSRQPATGPPGSYPDRTHTGRRRPASDQVMTAGQPPPDLWAHRLEYYPGQGGASAPQSGSPSSLRTPVTYTERGVKASNWLAWSNRA